MGSKAAKKSQTGFQRWRRLANLRTLAKRKAPAVGQTPGDVVFQENKWRLIRYRPSPEGRRYKTPILMVPSLINRHYVLDLMPGKSFAEWMVDQGHDVFVVDWGTPGPEDRYLTFDDVVDRYLGRALDRTCREAGTDKTHVLGYCLGGTMTTIHGAARPERFASMLALAAPVQFGGNGILDQWTNTPTFDIDALCNVGNVPWQLMQSAFHLLRPTMNLSKAMHVIDRAWDDRFLDGFFALETWGNDNVSFPAEVYRQYIKELYRENLLAKGQFYLSGRQARMEHIEFPVLTISFENDHIVPAESAALLDARISSTDKKHLHLPGGHVGAVVSSAAKKRLWPIIDEWFATRDTEAAGPKAGSKTSRAA